MRRNKTNYLIQFKSTYRSRGQWSPPIIQSTLPPLWFDEYHQIKDALHFVTMKNNGVAALLQRAKYERGLLLSQQINADLKTISNEAARVQDWATSAQKLGETPAETEILKHIKTYFLSEVSKEMRRLLSHKNMYNSLESELERSMSHHNNSFANVSFQNHSLNGSFNPQNTQTMMMRAHPDLSLHNAQQKDRELKQISQRIQALNDVMTNMNQHVYQQGSLIDRIDQNLTVAYGNMQKANQILGRRRDKQEGRGQFSFQGRANKCIVVLYVINVLLILAWFLKHL